LEFRNLDIKRVFSS